MDSFDFKTKPIGEFLRQKAEVSPQVLFTAESKFHRTPFFRVAYFYKALNKGQFITKGNRWKVESTLKHK